MEKVTFTITGTSILLMNSEAGVDDSSELSKAIKRLTDKKRNKTEADKEEINRLSWERAMYYDESIGPFIPAWNVKRSIQDAARLRKKGKDLERGVFLVSERFPLQYKGPRKIDAMHKSGKFMDIRTVRQAQSRILRARPRFEGWSLECEFFVDPTVINPEDFMEYVEAAGAFIGLGDYRQRFGKYQVAA